MQNANKSSKSNGKAPNSRAEVVINVGLIETIEKGFVSVKQGNHLAIKFAKKFSFIEAARVAMNKHADHDQFFLWFWWVCVVLSKTSISQFIHGTNIEFTVERYKEEIGKPYSKIDFIFVSCKQRG